MVVDYSKWDALELSDDSDIEVHPNVDKRSFIRAKQHKIHQERDHRRHQIATLKYERIINDGILQRIDRLLNALRHHVDSSKSLEEIVFHALLQCVGDPSEDQLPPRPEGVHSNVKEQPVFSKMMAMLVDQVKKSADESENSDKLQAFLEGVEGEKVKVQSLQDELLAKLAELEKIEGSKITSDKMHTGFNVSHVSRDAQPSTESGTAKTIELLNPSSSSAAGGPRATTGNGGDGDNDDDDDDDDEDDDDHTMDSTPESKEFSKIKIGDYLASSQFISQHPSILSEQAINSLLVDAFNNQMEGNARAARQCVNQSLLIQYCRSLGRDGVGLFFKRITTPGHQAKTLFEKDVIETYNRIKQRTQTIQHERSLNPSPAGDVEQVQLQAVDPGSQLHISAPPTDELAARAVFDAFPPDLRAALEASSLDAINAVLARMPVDQAELVVAQLSEAGMLSVAEGGVIDATTPEGKSKVRELRREARRKRDETDGAEDAGPQDAAAEPGEGEEEEEPQVKEMSEEKDPAGPPERLGDDVPS